MRLSVLAAALLISSAAYATSQSEFNGADAQTLAQQGQVVQTNCSITAAYQGKTLCFSNEGNRSQFMQNASQNYSNAQANFAKAGSASTPPIPSHPSSGSNQ